MVVDSVTVNCVCFLSFNQEENIVIIIIAYNSNVVYIIYFISNETCL